MIQIEIYDYMYNKLPYVVKKTYKTKIGFVLKHKAICILINNRMIYGIYSSVIRFVCNLLKRWEKNILKNNKWLKLITVQSLITYSFLY